MLYSAPIDKSASAVLTVANDGTGSAYSVGIKNWDQVLTVGASNYLLHPGDLFSSYQLTMGTSMSSTSGFTEGANKYLGMTFVTTEELDIYDSTLQHVYGDDWQVVSVDRRIPSGSEVKVVNVNGTKLEVQTVES